MGGQLEIVRPEGQKYAPVTGEEKELLRRMFHEGATLGDMARAIQRHRGTIRYILINMGLYDGGRRASRPKLPTPEEIEERKAQIQAGWTPQQRRAHEVVPHVVHAQTQTVEFKGTGRPVKED